MFVDQMDVDVAEDTNQKGKKASNSRRKSSDAAVEEGFLSA